MSSIAGVATLTGVLSAGQVAKNISLQNKTVVLSNEQQVIEADSGYDGLGEVTVPAVALENKTITPSDSVQTITAGEGYDGLGTVTVEAAPASSGYNFVMSESAHEVPGYFFQNNDEITGFEATVTNPVQIKSSAFDGCVNLKTFKLPKSGSSIGSDAFYGCTSLTDIYVGDNTMEGPIYLANSSVIPNTVQRIHVPASLLSDYQSNGNWSSHASKMIGDYVY